MERQRRAANAKALESTVTAAKPNWKELVMSIGARARPRILVVIIAVAALLVALVMPSVTGSSRALAQVSSVVINPTQGAPGVMITATGSNWVSGHHIQAIWDGTSGNYVGSPAGVNPDGS